MLKQFSYLWGSLFLLLLMPTVQAESTNKTFCRQYARDLMRLPQQKQQKQHKLPQCQRSQPYWGKNKAEQMQWCLSASKAEVNKKHYQHNKLVNRCDDTYKLIMVDRHRIASLLVNERETVKLSRASQKLRQVLRQENNHNPYQQYYPAISQAVKNNHLQQCDMYSLTVEMDNKVASKEWIITIDAACLPQQKTGHIWLLQQLNGVYSILFEGEASVLTLRHTIDNGYKNIAIKTRLQASEESKKRCGSIKAEWHYRAGRYLPFKGEADEHGDCLPEYNLPDHLQGENTFSLSEAGWKKSMAAEEKKRIALFAPYKASLEAYIPQWMKKMEQQAPITQVFTNQDVEIKTKKELEELEEKSFMKTVRDFLGLVP